MWFTIAAVGYVWVILNAFVAVSQHFTALKRSALLPLPRIRPTPYAPIQAPDTSAGVTRWPAAFGGRMDVIRSDAGTIDAPGPAAVIRPRPCALIRAPYACARARVYGIS